jgi:protein involved in polysaccharide export with SLBB domain
MKKFVIVMMVLLFAVFAFAQDKATRYSSNEKMTMGVKVWGEVVSPGIYQVPLEYDMLAILSYAGGPVNTAKLTNVKVIRGRKLEKDEPIVVYVDLDKYIETGDESIIPEIREGDTIMVPPKFGKNFVANFAALLAIAQSITIIAFYIDRIGSGY